MTFIDANAEEENGFSNLLYNLLHIAASLMALRDLIVTGLFGGLNLS